MNPEHTIFYHTTRPECVESIGQEGVKREHFDRRRVSLWIRKPYPVEGGKVFKVRVPNDWVEAARETGDFNGWWIFLDRDLPPPELLELLTLEEAAVVSIEAAQCDLQEAQAVLSQSPGDPNRQEQVRKAQAVLVQAQRDLSKL